MNPLMFTLPSLNPISISFHFANKQMFDTEDGVGGVTGKILRNDLPELRENNTFKYTDEMEQFVHHWTPE